MLTRTAADHAITRWAMTKETEEEEDNGGGKHGGGGSVSKGVLGGVPERSGLLKLEAASGQSAVTTSMKPGPVMVSGKSAASTPTGVVRKEITPGSHSLPSMVLVPLEALKAYRRVPRSSDRRREGVRWTKT